MRKVLAVVVLSLTAMSAMAQHHHGHGYHYRPYHNNSGWGPILGGAVLGAIVYDIYNRPVVVQQPPIVIQQSPIVVQQNCTPWIETMDANGIVTKTRTCYN